MADNNAKLNVGGNDHAFDVLDGSIGPSVVNISSLYKEYVSYRDFRSWFPKRRNISL